MSLENLVELFEEYEYLFYQSDVFETLEAILEYLKSIGEIDNVVCFGLRWLEQEIPRSQLHSKFQLAGLMMISTHFNKFLY
jgi:superfamily II helicase